MMKLMDSEKATNDSLFEFVFKMTEMSQAHDNDSKKLSLPVSPDLLNRDHHFEPLIGSQRSTMTPSKDNLVYTSQYNCFGISVRRKERGRSTDGNFPAEEAKEQNAQLSTTNGCGEQTGFDLKVALPFLFSSEGENGSVEHFGKPALAEEIDQSELLDKHSKYEFIQVSSRLVEDTDNYRFNRERKTRTIKPQFYQGFTHDFSQPVLAASKVRQFAAKTHQVRTKAQGSAFPEGFKDHAQWSLKLEPKANNRKSGRQQKKSRN